MSLASDMVYQLKGIADPVISPDGKRLVYVLSWVEGTGETAESRSRLMLTGPGQDGGREFTQGNADSGPRFSPGGEMLAFLRSRHPGEPRQVWVMHTHGGEARQLTDAPKGVQDFAWSPDGARIVFCADTEPAAGAAAGSQGGGPRVVEVNRIRFRQDLQGWRGDAHYHLFVAELESGEMTQITRGDWDDYGPVWSPDGTKIAFISGRRDDRDIRALTEAYVVNADGGVAECWSGGLYSVGAVAWSPDSRRLAVVGSEDPAGMVLWQGWLYIAGPGGEHRRITGDGQRPVLGGGPGAGPAAGDSLDRRRSHHLSGGAPRRELHLPGHGRGRRSLPALGRRPPGFRPVPRRRRPPRGGGVIVPLLPVGNPPGPPGGLRSRAGGRPQRRFPVAATGDSSGEIQP